MLTPRPCSERPPPASTASALELSEHSLRRNYELLLRRYKECRECNHVLQTRLSASSVEQEANAFREATARHRAESAALREENDRLARELRAQERELVRLTELTSVRSPSAEDEVRRLGARNATLVEQLRRRRASEQALLRHVTKLTQASERAVQPAVALDGGRCDALGLLEEEGARSKSDVGAAAVSSTPLQASLESLQRAVVGLKAELRRKSGAARGGAEGVGEARTPAPPSGPAPTRGRADSRRANRCPT